MNARILTKVAVGSSMALTAVASATMLERHDRRELSLREVESARRTVKKLAVSRQAHLNNLQHYGATVVPNVVVVEDLEDWQSRVRNATTSRDAVDRLGRLHYGVTKRDSPEGYYEDMAKLGGQSIKSKRLPLAEAGTNLLPPLVAAYFLKNGGKRYELTQLQFLNAIPACQNQIWHRDNIKPGLTAIVALADVSDNGPTELLLHSHLHKSISGMTARQIKSLFIDDNDAQDDKQPNIKTLLACLDKGQAILYDSRLLHRGRGFASNENDRPVLVLRWDALVDPPPGTGLIVTNLNRYLGYLLSVIVSMNEPR